ncbi:hypothetical protein [Streptomyces sp. MMS24-I29]|uniref:hypothetical protein n=1 Tax=Streptomyces sp. MMS24-I29 TaxID=3351480 RepID=UPI003C7D02BF
MRGSLLTAVRPTTRSSSSCSLAALPPEHLEGGEPATDRTRILAPDITGEGPYLVRWEIDSDEGVSPAQAALNAWRENFGGGDGQPSNEECCVFTIFGVPTGRSVEIDLSDELHTHLFR